jgi:hypothetical protein
VPADQILAFGLGQHLLATGDLRAGHEEREDSAGDRQSGEPEHPMQGSTTGCCQVGIVRHTPLWLEPTFLRISRPHLVRLDGLSKAPRSPPNSTCWLVH